MVLLGYELKSGDAVEPCSECTGGAWGTFKGWNFGEMNRCFINCYGKGDGYGRGTLSSGRLEKRACGLCEGLAGALPKVKCKS